jgi:hypothetical protein
MNTPGSIHFDKNLDLPRKKPARLYHKREACIASISKLTNHYSMHLPDLAVASSTMPMPELAEYSGINTGDRNTLYGGEYRDWLLQRGVQVPYPYIHHSEITNQLIIEPILYECGTTSHFQTVQHIARSYLQNGSCLVQDPALYAFRNSNLCLELFDTINECGFLDPYIDLYAITEQKTAPNRVQFIFADSQPGRKGFI